MCVVNFETIAELVFFAFNWIYSSWVWDLDDSQTILICFTVDFAFILRSIMCEIFLFSTISLVLFTRLGHGKLISKRANVTQTYIKHYLKFLNKVSEACSSVVCYIRYRTYHTVRWSPRCTNTSLLVHCVFSFLFSWLLGLEYINKNVLVLIITLQYRPLESPHEEEWLNTYHILGCVLFITFKGIKHHCALKINFVSNINLCCLALNKFRRRNWFITWIDEWDDVTQTSSPADITKHRKIRLSWQ